MWNVEKGRISVVVFMKMLLQQSVFLCFFFSVECRVAKSASYGRLPSVQGRSSPRGGGMSRRSKSPSSTGSGKFVGVFYLDTNKQRQMYCSKASHNKYKI